MNLTRDPQISTTPIPSSSADGTSAGDLRQYHRFYWPLALTGVVGVLAQQMQNATLARYPNAAYELATFALAAGLFHLFDAALIFTPQMVTVLARSPASARLCRKFIWRVGLLMTAPVALLAFPPLGRPMVGRLFRISGAQLDDVITYLGLLAPNILLLGFRHYYVGRIVQAKRTGWVTALNVLQVSVVGVGLILGRALGWRALFTLAVAALSASVIHLIGAASIAARLGESHAIAEERPLTMRAILEFFWPVALTSVMFSLTRPILYLFIARLSSPAPVIASMRVGFDFAMLFQNLINQFRHLFVTFGPEHFLGIRRYMYRITGMVVFGMALVAWTPLSDAVLGGVIGLEEEVLQRSRQVLGVMCLLPALIAWRNYYHGLAMVRQRTGPMGLGGVLRNGATYLGAAGLFAIGALNHVTATFVLLSGFVVETLTVIHAPALVRRNAAPRGPPP